jgi:hypothetical protein
MWRLRTQLSYIKKLKELMMDTLLITIAVIAFCAVGYVVLWTVRTVRRIGFRRFAKAMGALVWAMLVATAKLFTPLQRQVEQNDPKKDDHGWGDAWDDLRIAKKWQRISEINSKLGHTPKL